MVEPRLGDKKSSLVQMFQILPVGGTVARTTMVSDATSERARQLSVEKRWSQEAPVDGARSRRLSGTVYGLRILPLPAENAPCRLWWFPLFSGGDGGVLLGGGGGGVAVSAN